MVEVGIVNDGIPYSPTASYIPPLAAFPRLGCQFHFRVLERKRGVTGNSEEAPRLLPRFSIVRGNVASYPKFSAAIPYEHLPSRYSRSTGNGIVSFRVNHSIDFPNPFTGFCINGDEPPVQRRQIDVPFIYRSSTADGTTTGSPVEIPGNLRIVRPDSLTSGCVHSMKY